MADFSEEKIVMGAGISRRQFIERSAMGGLAIGFEYPGDPLRAGVSVAAAENGVQLHVTGKLSVQQAFGEDSRCKFI